MWRRGSRGWLALPLPALFSLLLSQPLFNVKAHPPSASTARLHPTRKVSEANKQPVTGEVSAANEQPGRGPRSGRAVQHTRGPRSGRAVQHARGPRSGRAVGYSKPPLGRAEQRSSVRIKTLALFERSEFASVPNAASSARDPKGTDVARLFFGYFFLATQKKVTRLPGRNPASHRREVNPANQTPQNKLSLLTSFRQSQKKVNRLPGRNPASHRREVNPPQQTPNKNPRAEKHLSSIRAQARAYAS